MILFHLSDEDCPNAPDLYRQADILVTTGDLRSYSLGWLRRIPESQRLPAFGVYGNHDVPGYMDTYGITNLHNQTVQHAGYLWGGFQGCLRYRPGDTLFTEDEAATWQAAFPTVDILLLHAGPYGLLDNPTDVIHRGSPSIRQYIERHQPPLVLCGHQYSDATLRHDHTTLYRTYGGRLLHIDLETYPTLNRKGIIS